MRALLALDQGGHASRACLVDAHGRLLAEQQVPIATVHGSAGEVEHDPQQILASLQSAARGVLRSAAGLEIEAAGLATQRSTIVCFERSSGVALSSAISWQDRRNEPWLTSFAREAARVAELTGLPLSPHYGVGKMRWCLDHLPAVQRAREHGELVIAPLAAYLAMRLTGGAALADPANASRTLLFDSARRDWSSELLQLFGIERAWLPLCTPTRTRYGALRLGGDAGGSQAIELRAVTGDQSAIPFAFGSPDSACVYINLGTGAFLQRPCSTRPGAAAPLLASVLVADREHALYSLEGTVNGAGAAMSRFAADALVTEPSLWQGLEQLPPGGALPVYVNGVGGLGSPFWRSQQRSYFIGEGSTVERFAAVLESIAFLIAINFDCMAARGGPPSRVIASGGLSRSDWLCRRLAALLGAPLLRGAQEASVLGVATLADSTLADAALFGDLPQRQSWSCASQRFNADELPGAERAALRVRRARFEAALHER